MLESKILLNPNFWTSNEAKLFALSPALLKRLRALLALSLGNRNPTILNEDTPQWIIKHLMIETGTHQDNYLPTVLFKEWHHYSSLSDLLNMGWITKQALEDNPHLPIELILQHQLHTTPLHPEFHLWIEQATYLTNSFKGYPSNSLPWNMVNANLVPSQVKRKDIKKVTKNYLYEAAHHNTAFLKHLNSEQIAEVYFLYHKHLPSLTRLKTPIAFADAPECPTEVLKDMSERFLQGQDRFNQEEDLKAYIRLNGDTEEFLTKELYSPHPRIWTRIAKITKDPHHLRLLALRGVEHCCTNPIAPKEIFLHQFLSHPYMMKAAPDNVQKLTYKELNLIFKILQDKESTYSFPYELIAQSDHHDHLRFLLERLPNLNVPTYLKLAKNPSAKEWQSKILGNPPDLSDKELSDQETVELLELLGEDYLLSAIIPRSANRFTRPTSELSQLANQGKITGLRAVFLRLSPAGQQKALGLLDSMMTRF